jgi:hypothetical protein
MQGACVMVPRLPALGWATFAGPKKASLPCVLDALHSRFTVSGRAAIALALRAIGVRAGDRVLVPTYHCPTMIAPVVAAGAEPVFYGIDSLGSPRLDALDVERIRGTRALIAAHYFGLPQPMGKVRAFCDRHGLALIEDCAHALFGMSDGRPVGHWGDYAIASLTKFLPVMDGGLLVSARPLAGARMTAPSLKVELRSIANAVEIGAHFGRLPGMNHVLAGLFGAAARLRGRARGIGARNESEPRKCKVAKWLANDEQLNTHRDASRWTRFAAGHARRDRIVALRRRNYSLLAGLIADTPGIRPLRPEISPGAAPYVFPVYVEQPESIYLAVRASGIPVFRWDELWPGCPTLAGDVGLDWATHVFQLGCHQDLRPQEIGAIARVLSMLVMRDQAPVQRQMDASGRYAHSSGLPC